MRIDFLIQTGTILGGRKERIKHRAERVSVLPGGGDAADMVEEVSDDNQFGAGLLQILVFDDKEALPIGGNIVGPAGEVDEGPIEQHPRRARAELRAERDVPGVYLLGPAEEQLPPVARPDGFRATRSLRCVPSGKPGGVGCVGSVGLSSAPSPEPYSSWLVSIR